MKNRNTKELHYNNICNVEYYTNFKADLDLWDTTAEELKGKGKTKEEQKYFNLCAEILNEINGIFEN